MAEINPYEPLLGRVEALALEGYSPAVIAKALNVRVKVVQTRFKWLRELGSLPRDWRPTRE